MSDLIIAKIINITLPEFKPYFSIEVKLTKYHKKLKQQSSFNEFYFFETEKDVVNLISKIYIADWHEYNIEKAYLTLQKNIEIDIDKYNENQYKKEMEVFAKAYKYGFQIEIIYIYYIDENNKKIVMDFNKKIDYS